MGTSGVGIYDDDGAADWVDELESRGLDLVHETLDDGLASDPIWSDVAARALAAADVVARLHTGIEPNAAYVGEWVEQNSSVDVSHLLEMAQQVVERIGAADSGLRDLWAETELLGQWLEVVDDVAQRLRLEPGAASNRTASVVPPPVSLSPGEWWTKESYRESAKIHGLAFQKDLTRSEQYETRKRAYRPGSVIAIPILGEMGGTDHTYSVALIRSCNWLGLAQFYLFPIWTTSQPSMADVASLISPEKVLEGWWCSPPILAGITPWIGDIEEFDVEEWPLFVEYRPEPWLLEEKRFKPRALMPVSISLEMPNGSTPDQLSQAWVPNRSGIMSIASRRMSELQGGNTLGTGNWAWAQNYGRPTYG